MKAIWMVVVVVVLAAMLPGNMLGKGSPQKMADATERVGTAGAVSRKTVSIAVDPRIELLAVVQHFTGWAQKGHIKSKTAYKSDIDRYFGQFKDHPAIAYAESLFNSNFTYDAPVQFVLCHGSPPALEQKVPYSDYLIARAGGEPVLVRFAEELRDFARKTDFSRFYEAHSTLYETLATEVGILFEDKNYAEALEDFYGESMGSYNLVLAPLFSGNYGISVEGDQGEDLYCVMGPCSLKGDRTTFACLNYLESMILHEWSHPFVNPLVDENYELFERSIHLFEPIKRMMQRQAYPTWRITLYEHLVRACGEIHLRAQLDEAFDRAEYLRYHEGKGFWYVGCIDSLLDIYERKRERYPQFKDFVPIIAARLSEMSLEDLPDRITAFTGPLDAIFNRTDCIYLVYPTGIDEASTNQIKRDLQHFAGFLSSARIKPVIVSDEEAVEIEWQDKVAFVYGTPGANCFLERLSVSIPLGFHGGVIEFGGEKYDGDVFLITCLPNPFNRRLPFAFCVANRPEDLVGIASKIQSPAEWSLDYILFRGNEKLFGGLYRKEQDRWLVTPQEKQ